MEDGEDGMSWLWVEIKEIALFRFSLYMSAVKWSVTEKAAARKPL